MALNSTIFKARLAIADMDRSVYGDHALTIARHPSETDERMMVRLLAYALHTPVHDTDGALELAKGLADADEPDLWQRDLTGRILHWIDVGQPDEKRTVRAAGRADRVTLITYGPSAPIWWRGVSARLSRLRNAAVWLLPPAESAALATLAQRSMQLQVTVQEGTVWVGDGSTVVELQPAQLGA